ncbi:acyl-CoA dehydrogenase [Pseudonocardia sp. KRD-184]|uniref:Acyl-CoA dehydrogenase n=1 Tax=Pseudonocardia oceani TaxID=2792013 RepID=A0ABS6UFF3_9PSEU|nr:acyl-CoA dehydrogenase [Pseudonocardia oceani]MBW0092723.1 acyl-CoA dehydrogenase [Pseudonocardia oceani]MBW0099526.1 acyl-CoA dehydrogenase [Pseudonocardia oceani]MBW0112143.1 acyl-CoA dehydrogenase [Pseudonocardia oceani]MBW0124544.1 acyl-CoA dehydrogenase [Pseudonocardia oceani]MBW0130970.1 acyl-CoA dehydrogenase [Pseudonocardia oceani]
MRSLLLSRRDLDFLLHEWLDVGALTARERFAEHSRETFDAVLDLSEQVATEQFAPHNRTADLHEPEFDGERVHMIPEVGKALEAFAATGITAAGMDESVGGMQLPQTVAQACFLWFQAANVGTSAYPFLTIANANLLLAHGTPEQVETWVGPMVEGRYFGTMCLSEPQAGSSLADITTRAEPRDDGTYRLSGNKMWISGGDHDLSENIVHLVLAKVPGGPAGVKGISLFIVPKFLPGEDGADGQRNDVSLAGVNHKMGFRGTVNTLLNFGEGRHTPGGEAGAVGYLVGEEGRGLALMFHMMNEARVGVGGNAAALGYTGYLHALDYARTRTQGRPPTAKSGPPVPIIEHPDVARMLLAQKSYAEGAVALILYCARLLDDERTGATEDDRARAHLLLDTLTPIAKSWPSQWCLAANDLAIQVHGGYGYTREYAVEQFWRDNRLNMIHEGTHGIQGLDLLGRKVVLHDGAGLRLLLETVTRTVDAARAAGLDDHADALAAAVARTGEVTAALWAAGDPAVSLANSSIYLEAVGHVVVAWMWLEQLVAAAGREGDFYDGKRAAAGYFFRHELPRTGPQFALLESLDRTTLDVRPEWF